MSGPYAILDTLSADVVSAHITFSRRRDQFRAIFFGARPFDVGHETLV
jgi:hypothetical protein